MSFRAKMLSALAAVGILPIVLLGTLSFSANRAELEKAAGDGQELLAAEAARAAEAGLARAIESLRLSVGLLPYDQLTSADLAAALRIPFGQLRNVDALALLDARGLPVVPPLADRAPSPLSPGEVREFLGRAPAELAAEAGTALGTPFTTSRGDVRVAVAVRVSRAPVRIVAVRLALEDVEHEIAGLSRRSRAAALLTLEGARVAGAPRGPLSSDERALLEAANTAHVPLSRVLTAPAVLASAAPAGGLGWFVLLEQPAGVAYGPALRVRRYVLYWALIALGLTALLGAVLSRELARPLATLKQKARALEQGRYDEADAAEGDDELGKLGRAFNHMSREVQRRDGEIRAWNAELQKRVEARSAELRAAQDQILRARRLAAIGSLGAGLAHEINNPLMAISGLAALLRRSVREPAQEATLDKLQQQVSRVARIVDDLRQFAVQERAASGRRFLLEEPVRTVLGRYEKSLADRRIAVEVEVQQGLRETEGDPVQIEQVVEHLVKNAIDAMPQGGALRVALSDVAGDSVKLTVADTGRGIPTALRERIFDPFFTTRERAETGVGLGLSVSHTIIEAHHGRILVDSAEGQGATFTVLLPAAAAAVHLA